MGFGVSEKTSIRARKAAALLILLVGIVLAVFILEYIGDPDEYIFVWVFIVVAFLAVYGLWNGLRWGRDLSNGIGLLMVFFGLTDGSLFIGLWGLISMALIYLSRDSFAFVERRVGLSRREATLMILLFFVFGYFVTLSASLLIRQIQIEMHDSSAETVQKWDRKFQELIMEQMEEKQIEKIYPHPVVYSILPSGPHLVQQIKVPIVTYREIFAGSLRLLSAYPTFPQTPLLMSRYESMIDEYDKGEEVSIGGGAIFYVETPLKTILASGEDIVNTVVAFGNASKIVKNNTPTNEEWGEMTSNFSSPPSPEIDGQLESLAEDYLERAEGNFRQWQSILDGIEHEIWKRLWESHFAFGRQQFQEAEENLGKDNSKALAHAAYAFAVSDILLNSKNRRAEGLFELPEFSLVALVPLGANGLPILLIISLGVLAYIQQEGKSAFFVLAMGVVVSVVALLVMVDGMSRIPMKSEAIPTEFLVFGGAASLLGLAVGYRANMISLIPGLNLLSVVAGAVSPVFLSILLPYTKTRAVGQRERGEIAFLAIAPMALFYLSVLGGFYEPLFLGLLYHIFTIALIYVLVKPPS